MGTIRNPEGDPRNRGGDSLPEPGAFWLGVIPEKLAAQKRIDALHQAADDDIRLQRPRPVGDRRDASAGEIRDLLRGSRQGPQPDAYTQTSPIFDESANQTPDAPTANFRDLGRGESTRRIDQEEVEGGEGLQITLRRELGKRTQSLMSGERTGSSRSPKHPNGERRDKAGKGGRPQQGRRR